MEDEGNGERENVCLHSMRTNLEKEEAAERRPFAAPLFDVLVEVGSRGLVQSDPGDLLEAST